MNPGPERNDKQVVDYFLRVIAGKKRAAAAEALGWDESRMSRVLTGERAIRIDEFLDLLAAFDLALMAAEGGQVVTVPTARYRALLTLANERMAELQELDEGRVR